ncbi:MAG: hypothetical protein WAO98_01650, partial [Alphaproteobacteria bacterium]
SLADAFSLYSDLLHDPALKNTSRIRYGSKKAQLLAQAVNTVDENDQPWTPQSQEKWLVFEDGSSAKETRISGATRPTAMKKAKGRKLRR